MRVLIWHKKDVPWLPYLYSPVTDTLLAGFRAASGVDLVLGWGTTRPGTNRPDAPAFVRNLSSLQRGDVYVWVGMGTGWEMWQTPWKDLWSRGVTCVLYQTEPADICIGSRTGRYPVHEIWDFSLHNFEACQGKKDGPIPRYVPLAHVPGSPAVRPPLRGVERPMMFFGDPSNRYPKRKACYKKLKSALGSKVRHTYRAFSHEMFATNVLAHNDIFVNLHKGCGQAHNPFTWRNAKLLNSQKMIISERAHPKDETEYDGMMLWAENMSHVVALYRHYAGGAWRDFAQKAAARFRRKFDAVDIFERAGIYRRLGLSLADGERRRGVRGRATNVSCELCAPHKAP